MSAEDARGSNETTRQMRCASALLLLPQADRLAAHLGNGCLYVIGSLAFIIGSVLFFPRFAHLEGIGVDLFIIGSLAFLMASTWDWIELYRPSGSQPDDDEGAEQWLLTTTQRPRVPVERLPLLYCVANFGFFIGSCLFFPKEGPKATRTGTYIFIVDSAYYVVVAMVDWCRADRVLSTIPPASLQRYHWVHMAAFTATIVGCVLFVTGSTCFLFASVEVAGVWQFCVGSLLFLVSAVAALVFRLMYHFELEKPEARERSMFVPLAGDE